MSECDRCSFTTDIFPKLDLKTWFTCQGQPLMILRNIIQTFVWPLTRAAARQILSLIWDKSSWLQLASRMHWLLRIHLWKQLEIWIGNCRHAVKLMKLKYFQQNVSFQSISFSTGLKEKGSIHASVLRTDIGVCNDTVLWYECTLTFLSYNLLLVPAVVRWWQWSIWKLNQKTIFCKYTIIWMHCD